MFFLILAILCLTLQTILGQSVIQLPKDVIVEWQTEKVRLECQVANFTGNLLTWGYIGDDFDSLYLIRPDGSIIPVQGANQRFQNFEIVKNGTNYDMVIRDVEIEDEGEYACYFGSKPDHGAKLTIIAQPKVWIESNGEDALIEVVEGEEVVGLKCWAEKGHPPADLVWLIEGKEFPCYNIEHSQCYQEEEASNGTSTTQSSTILIPSKKDHNHTIECQSLQLLDSGERVNQSRDGIVLYVLFAPKVLLAWNSSRQEAECSASANPSNLTYKWCVNGEWDSSAKDQTKWSLGNSRGHFQIICQVTNSIGSGRDSINIYIEECTSAIPNTSTVSKTRTIQNSFFTENTIADVTSSQKTTYNLDEQVTNHLTNRQRSTTNSQKTLSVSENVGKTSESIYCPDSGNNTQTENPNVTLIIQVILVALVCSEAIVIVILTLVHFKPKPKHRKREIERSSEKYKTSEI